MLTQWLQWLWQEGIGAHADPFALVEAAAIAGGLCAVVVGLQAASRPADLPLADRDTRIRLARAAHVVAQAAGKAVADLRAVDFADVDGAQLADAAAAAKTVKIQLSSRVGATEISLLAHLPQMSSLAVCGDNAIPLDILGAIEALPSLQCLDLRESPVVVDSNNSVWGMCKVTDIFDFQQRRQLAWLALPRRCAVQVGEVG